MCDEADVPDRDTCQKLIEDFVSVTATNGAIAQEFLQNNKWELMASVEAFYEALEKENESEDDEVIEVKTENTAEHSVPSSDQNTFSDSFTTTPPPILTLLSWNLDGLDPNNLKRRTRFVVEKIIELQPDIIFFQEVIQESGDYLINKLPEYRCVKGGEADYFTLTMIRVFTVYYDSHKIIEFETSRMGRNLLLTEAHMGKLKLKLLNVHLESTAEHSEERKKQLKLCFKTAKEFPDTDVILFGGDMNMRDKELNEVGGIPDEFHDIWIYCGSNKHFQYTWDMTRNTNRQFPGRYKPRCRFDRVYMRNSKPVRVIPKTFSLLGAQKVPETQSFASDHWGIFIVFDVKH